MSASKTRAIAVIIVVLAIAVTAALLVRSTGRGDSPSIRSGANAESEPRIRSLSEAGRAKFISIIVYVAGEPSVSYMAASGTEEFTELAGAIAGAQPQAGTADETFSDLLVVSFGRGDTLDLSYSPGRNLLLRDDQAYRPQGDIQQVIDRVRDRMDS